MRRWKCTVCGYIHTGEEPPEECPVCKAPKDKFVEIDTDGNVIPAESKAKSLPAEESSLPDKTTSSTDKFTDFILRHHLHPIFVHAPNGIIPIIVLFLFLGIFLNAESLRLAAFYNLIALLLVMPAVMITGYMEWKNRYNKAKTALFFTKITCSLVVFATILILTGWRFINPNVTTPASPVRWIYLLIALIMLAAAGAAGFIGGKLVFGTRDK